MRMSEVCRRPSKSSRNEAINCWSSVSLPRSEFPEVVKFRSFTSTTTQSPKRMSFSFLSLIWSGQLFKSSNSQFGHFLFSLIGSLWVSAHLVAMSGHFHHFVLSRFICAPSSNQILHLGSQQEQDVQVDEQVVIQVVSEERVARSLSPDRFRSLTHWPSNTPTLHCRRQNENENFVHFSLIVNTISSDSGYWIKRRVMAISFSLRKRSYCCRLWRLQFKYNI
jgi:hypothetical protein